MLVSEEIPMSVDMFMQPTVKTGTFHKEHRCAVHSPSIIGHLAGVFARVAGFHRLKLQRA